MRGLIAVDDCSDGRKFSDGEGILVGGGWEDCRWRMMDGGWWMDVGSMDGWMGACRYGEMERWIDGGMELWRAGWTDG